MFYFLHEFKQKSRSDITGQHQWPVDSDVTEGVKLTESNRLKFRLGVLKLLYSPDLKNGTLFFVTKVFHKGLQCFTLT